MIYFLNIHRYSFNIPKFVNSSQKILNLLGFFIKRLLCNVSIIHINILNFDTTYATK